MFTCRLYEPLYPILKEPNLLFFVPFCIRRAPLLLNDPGPFLLLTENVFITQIERLHFMN